MNIRIVTTNVPGEFIVTEKDWIGTHEVFRGTYEECCEFISPSTPYDYYHL